MKGPERRECQLPGETDLLVGQPCPVCGKMALLSRGRRLMVVLNGRMGVLLEGHSIEIALQLLGSFARFMDVRRASRNCVTIVS